MNSAKKQNSRKLNLIFRFLKGSEGIFGIALLASFATTGLNALTPQIFRFAVDDVLTDLGHPWIRSHLWVLALAVILVNLASGATQFVSRYYVAKTGETFAKNLRDALFIHVQRLPMSWHDENQTGDIIQRCTSDVNVVRNFVMQQLLELFRVVFLIIVNYGIMMTMNVKLSLIILVFIPIIVLYSYTFYRLIGNQFLQVDEAEGVVSTLVQENATGVRVVRAFGRELFEMNRFREKIDINSKLNIRLGTIMGAYWGVGDFFSGLQIILVIVLGAIEAVHGQLTVGEFIAFASYNTTLVWPIRSLGRILSEMSKAGVSFERIDHILGSEMEDYKEEENSLPEHLDIDFRHVSFAYKKDLTVLHDVNLTVKEGETIGILGATGSGKSTVTQLLTRLYEPKDLEGKITIDGIDIREIPLSWLRNHIGMVLQEPFLYSRTIRDNIAIFRPDATLEEIREAAKIACVDEAIMNFVDGYDTVVGERGVTLSGGQRQRVAIARMLLQNPKVMIFDDSLSAVDAETDLAIRKALKVHMAKATVIIISHRINSLMGADKIYVMNKGRICEEGTHRELIGQNGIYRKIYDIQMSHDDREAVMKGRKEGRS